MNDAPLLALTLWVRALRWGPMRLTAYGVSATAGVLLAMTVAARGARRVGVSPEAAWDAGLLAVVSCFAASRLLLVLHDPLAFTRYPALVLSLPSLTWGGMGLAALIVWLSLRRKHLPVLPMLDAFAPAGALLAAALEVGHWLDGTEPGMPIGFWQHGRAWTAVGMRLYPVAALGALAAAALSLVLFWTLSRATAGAVAALAMVAGGLAALLLGMLTLPDEVVGDGWLEPGTVASLGTVLAGALLWTLRPAVGTPPERAPDRKQERIECLPKI